jgi:hypothetical protein
VRQRIQHRLTNDLLRKCWYSEFEKPERKFLLRVGGAFEGVLNALHYGEQAARQEVVSRHIDRRRLEDVLHLVLWAQFPQHGIWSK